MKLEASRQGDSAYALVRGAVIFAGPVIALIGLGRVSAKSKSNTLRRSGPSRW